MKKIWLIILILCLCVFVSCESNENNTTITSSETTNAKSNQKQGDNTMSKEFNQWLGDYKTVASESLNGNLSIYSENELPYASIYLNVNGGTLSAKLFAAIDAQTVELSLVEYDEKSTIKNFQVGDIVVCLKIENNEILTMLSIEKYIGTWQEIFVE